VCCSGDIDQLEQPGTGLKLLVSSVLRKQWVSWGIREVSKKGYIKLIFDLYENDMMRHKLM